MSNTQRKKIVETASAQRKAPIKAKRSGSGTPAQSVEPKNLVFGKENFLWMIGGIVLIALGLVLMSGGKMPSPDVWDENLIYNPRRIIVAPAIILLGLIVEIIAIFKKSSLDHQEV